MATTIKVMGKPVPEGSTKAFPIRRKNGSIGVSITHAQGDNLLMWRNNIAQAYFDAHGRFYGKDEAVMLHVTFVFIRPKSVSAKKRPHCIVKPDLDKLVRAVGDALTGVCYADDSQIISTSAMKVYSDWEGAIITVEEPGVFERGLSNILTRDTVWTSNTDDAEKATKDELRARLKKVFGLEWAEELE